MEKKLTKAEEVANKIKEAQNKGYEVVSNTYPTDGVSIKMLTLIKSLQ